MIRVFTKSVMLTSVIFAGATAVDASGCAFATGRGFSRHSGGPFLTAGSGRLRKGVAGNVKNPVPATSFPEIVKPRPF
jgi:hypothetical protein